MDDEVKTINEFNIYCDESRVENPDSSKMVIGSLFVPRGLKQQVTNELESILRKSSFSKELKWVKTDDKYLDLYKKVLDYFVSKPDLKFRCIVVDKTKVKYEAFHEGDPEVAFFKFYYFMLRQKLLDNSKYYIFLDRKPARDKNRARALKAYLDSYILLHRPDCSIKHLQAYSSSENLLLQLADYLTGLTAFSCNVKGSKSSAKSLVVEHLESKLEKEVLCLPTSLAEEKFNVFVWTPRKI